ncbi:pre-B-cell leukemia homeobox interacting protein 1b isoform X3 [Brachyhypopomus gauderio]|uniref:pre-B-cell leukemia homeobox interacting protein 1b isoform X3 n=1 Tax=Brachyhypopomus gauderio TaxID=698409 RepID=UPI0040419787
MSDNSSGNSWTFLTSEVKEPGVEREGVQGQDGASSCGSKPPQSEQQDTGLSQGEEPPASCTEDTDGPEPPEQVEPLESGGDAATALKDDPVPSGNAPVENLSSLTSDPSEHSPSNQGEGERLLDPESETFSDSFAPTSPSAGAAPEGQEGEELPQEDENSELRRSFREEESKPDFESLEEKVNEGTGVRRRNITMLTAQPHHDEDEEDDLEEHFQPTPKDDGFGFSLNKCIFGALVLLGLGTIIFSGKSSPLPVFVHETDQLRLRVVFEMEVCCSAGVLLDLDDVGDADVGELKDPELQKEWKSPGSPAAPAQPVEVLERLAEHGQRVVELQTQLQKQEEQLKAAHVQVEEGSKERMRREELEVENQRLKEELDKLPALQKQLEEETRRLKRLREDKKNKQGHPTMKKALESLRAKAVKLSQSAAPVQPSAEHEQVTAANHGGKEPKEKKCGKEQEQSKEWRKSRRGKAEVEKPWMERDRVKTDGKKKGEQVKEKAHQEEDKELKGKGERKDERLRTKGTERNDGKGWKDGAEKRTITQDGGKGDRKDDAKWKKEKHWGLDSRREEPKEKKGSGNKVKDDKEWKHGKEGKRVEQPGGNEWKGRRNGKKEQEGGREKNNHKNDGKHDQAQKERTGKGKKDLHKGNDEKVWKDREEKRRSGRERDWSNDEGTEAWKEVKKTKGEHQNGEKRHGKDKAVHSSSDEAYHHSHDERRYDEDHMNEDYWTRQRERIRHYHGSSKGCTDVPACARAEGVVPVPQRDFESLLMDYLSRLLGPEEQMSKKEELGKLVGEFFTDGVFIHDQIPFGEFVEDVADILEDVAEDEDKEEMEDEMEGFAREAMEKFALPDRRGSGQKSKGVSG